MRQAYIHSWYYVLYLFIYIQGERNTSRKKDQFQEYAKEEDGYFICKFCEHKFPRGASWIKLYLTKVKGLDIDICTKWLNNVHVKAYLEIKGPNKKLKTTSTSGNAKESKNSSNPISKNCHTVDYL